MVAFMMRTQGCEGKTILCFLSFYILLLFFPRMIASHTYFHFTPYLGLLNFLIRLSRWYHQRHIDRCTILSVLFCSFQHDIFSLTDSVFKIILNSLQYLPTRLLSMTLYQFDAIFFYSSQALILTCFVVWLIKKTTII